MTSSTVAVTISKNDNAVARRIRLRASILWPHTQKQSPPRVERHRAWLPHQRLTSEQRHFKRLRHGGQGVPIGLQRSEVASELPWKPHADGGADEPVDGLGDVFHHGHTAVDTLYRSEHGV